MTEEEQAKLFIEEILGFSKPWRVEKIEKDLEKEKIIINLDYPKGTKFKCPVCGEECPIYDSKVREIRHMDLWQYKTFIKVRIPRVECKCGKKKDITPIFKA